MRLFCAAILMALSILSSAAQEKIKVTGNIITTDGKPAEFVSVMLENTTYGTTADAEGFFSLAVPEGEYTLVVESLFTLRKEMPVHILKGQKNHYPDIRVQEDINQLDQVVVTGQFAPQSMQKSLYKVRSVGTQTIKMKSPASIEALLNTEIGIRISNDMALGESNFELMGMSGNNVKVLLDGIALLDRGSKKQSLSQLDVNSIERIEIVEGPMSVIYGTDALAGVINIITKKGSKVHNQTNWYANARLHEESNGKEYGFFHKGGQHNESVDFGMNFRNGLYFNASATRNDNGGWTGDKTGREKRWHPKDQMLLGGMIGWRARNFNVWYRLNYTDESIYTPGNANSDGNYINKDFLTDRQNHQLQADWNISSKWLLNFAMSYQNYTRRTRSYFTSPETGKSWLSKEPGGQDVTNYNSMNARLTATWNLHPKISLQPGLEYQNTTGYGNRVKGKNHISDLAFFLSAEYKPLDWLSFRPGVRTFLYANYKNPIAVPSILSKVNLTPDMDLRLSYAYGFRTPTIQEMYMDFIHQDNHITGNPNLKAEYSNNVTASYNYRILHNDQIRLSMTLSGFFNMFKDKIGITQSIDDPTIHTHYNIDDYKTAGGTFESNLTWKNLTANANFSLVGRYNRYSKEVNQNSQFRYSPEAGANVSYSVPKWGTSLSCYYKFTGKRAEYFFGATKENEEVLYLETIPAYHYADITLTQKITSYIKLHLGVKNLFNLTSLQVKADRTDMNFLPTLYMGCGRSFFMSLNVNLDGKLKNKKKN